MESEGAGKMERGSLYLISLIVCSSFNLTPFRSSAGASIYLSVNIGILIEHRGGGGEGLTRDPNCAIKPIRSQSWPPC